MNNSGTVAVAGYSAAIGISGDLAQAAASLGVGLLGVTLARTVFVDRENRRLRRRQTFRETGPTTGVAMLIASVVILDRSLGLSGAALTGLGVGWTAMLLLDVIGKRVLDGLRAGLAIQPDDFPADLPSAPLLPRPDDATAIEVAAEQIAKID